MLFYDPPGEHEGYRRNYQHRGNRRGYDRRAEETVPHFFNSAAEKTTGEDKSQEELKMAKAAKEDPFGGIKPRDENEYEKHKLQRKSGEEQQNKVPKAEEPEHNSAEDEVKDNIEETNEETKDKVNHEESVDKSEYSKGGYYQKRYENYDYYPEQRYGRRGRGRRRGRNTNQYHDYYDRGTYKTWQVVLVMHKH